MRWRDRRQSSNVEDRRGQGGGAPGGGFGRSPIRLPIGRGGGGGSLSGIVILVVIFFALRACGIDPLQLLDGGGSATQQQTTMSRGQPADEAGQFVAVVLAETEDVWNGIFQSEG